MAKRWRWQFWAMRRRLPLSAVRSTPARSSMTTTPNTSPTAREALHPGALFQRAGGEKQVRQAAAQTIYRALGCRGLAQRGLLCHQMTRQEGGLQRDQYACRASPPSPCIRSSSRPSGLPFEASCSTACSRLRHGGCGMDSPPDRRLRLRPRRPDRGAAADAGQLPGEHIIYFGDTGRVPYGGPLCGRRITEVRPAGHPAFCCSFDLKAIMIACNTADATARQAIAGEYPVPIFGVAEPSARAAVAATKNEKVGLIGTTATIGTKIYERLMKAMRPTVQVMPRACPLLVPMVENGRIHRGDTVIETLVAEYLQPLKDWGCDTLVLGCTHYPLLWDVIAAFMGPGLH